jgi:hypothetical protein
MLPEASATVPSLAEMVPELRTPGATSAAKIARGGIDGGALDEIVAQFHRDAPPLPGVISPTVAEAIPTACVASHSLAAGRGPGELRQ